jgi:hypothetical protein
MPKPSYLVNTSPDHWQVSWNVQGFGKEQAEEMMRGMVREFGADPAATDCSRVMRVPGFASHKRSGHMVRMEQFSTVTYSPDQFPRLAHGDRTAIPETGARRVPRGHVSQSELDWTYARRALSRGESPESVAEAIVRYRQGEKPNVEYYAQLTVQKAAASLSRSTAPREDPGPER